MPEQFTVLIMAAGQGTRMRSALPKVLHPVVGKPMIEWVIDSAREAGAGRVVCIVRPGDGVAEGLPGGVDVAEQVEGEGTGSAVLAARAHLDGRPEPVLVLSGDHPLVPAADLQGLFEAHRERGAAATILTTDRLDPAGYGRIVRAADGSVDRIVETKYTDGLSAEELAVREINLGTYAFDPARLLQALDEVATERGERYLTGAIAILRAQGDRIETHLTDDPSAALGVNDRAGLMEAEEVAARRILERHARAGVTFLQPGTTRVEEGVEIGPDTVVSGGVDLIGATRVGAGCEIGPHSTIRDSSIGDGALVVHSYLVEAEVHAQAKIGPFAYLRPGAVVEEGAKIGTFVEVKNSVIGAGAKVPHLSYIGDADVGESSNIGASTITANYDGRKKHRTKLGKRVKTGIHTSLVAPVDVGDGAYTGAGSTISEDVPPNALGIARSKQKNVEGYADRVEEEERK
ncbi:MAG TPA: bifunctional UDP-N-acetylglucosamine diphosphorylase/glucosamine-1-phosphate N-acetyltransferase GlmU [Thermoleophilaceae bacterium]|jgi:bifunctional UDP-N-acetylglucosamine pyrophosphorylase/glucosamine-1-phosphate N-acetyltransferase